MSVQTIPVVAVVGPTAAGKTALAIELAKRFHGEIVSADSMQVYNNMPIASATPTKEELDAVPHHLVGFLSSDTSFSVADYVALAHTKIAEISARGYLPFVVGGTGLYVDALLDHICFESEKKDEAVTARLENELRTLGAEEMLSRLAAFDPQTAARLSSHDHRRILRATEVYLTTGLTLTEQNRRSRAKQSPYRTVYIGVTYENRALLYDRINHRVDFMLQNGLLDEAYAARNGGATAKQAIGHKEFYPYFDGQITLDEAVEMLKQSTRRYAKRQITWFRKNEKIHWLCADRLDVTAAATELLEREGF